MMRVCACVRYVFAFVYADMMKLTLVCGAFCAHPKLFRIFGAKRHTEQSGISTWVIATLRSHCVEAHVVCNMYNYAERIADIIHPALA